MIDCSSPECKKDRHSAIPRQANFIHHHAMGRIRTLPGAKGRTAGGVSATSAL
jgi:hypothetical protein